MAHNKAFASGISLSIIDGALTIGTLAYVYDPDNTLLTSISVSATITYASNAQDAYMGLRDAIRAHALAGNDAELILLP